MPLPCNFFRSFSDIPDSRLSSSFSVACLRQRAWNSHWWQCRFSTRSGGKLSAKRKAGSHHVLRRQQRQKTEEADANPREEPKRCSEETGAHPRRLSELGGFGKSGPGSLVRGSWWRLPSVFPSGSRSAVLGSRPPVWAAGRWWWRGCARLCPRPSRIARREAPERSNGAVSRYKKGQARCRSPYWPNSANRRANPIPKPITAMIASPSAPAKGINLERRLRVWGTGGSIFHPISAI